MEAYLYLYLIFSNVLLILSVPLLLIYNYRTPHSMFKTNAIYNYSSFFITFTVILIFYLLGSYFIGLRSLDAGFDTPSYVRSFLEIDDIFSAREVGINTFGNTELLYWPVQSFLKNFIPDPQSWLFLQYSITFLFISLSYKYLVKDTFVPMFIFVFVLLTFDLVYFGNALRQGLAFPIGVISIYFFIHRKYFTYLLLVFLSISLHWSSLIFLLAPLFQLILNQKRLFLLLFYLVLPILSFSIINIAYHLSQFLGIDVLVIKFELYLHRETHFGSLYSLVNFWYCIFFASLVVLFNNVFKQYRMLYLLHTLFLSLILIGVSVPDLSERFLYSYIFLTPMITYIFIFKILPLKQDVLNIFLLSISYILFFILLGFFVLRNESARITLAY